jgi:CheY-like chemotaxis protein
MPRTLLLADDSVTIQRVIELTFADEDIQVTAVSDGDEAIARIESNPPDIVLADVGMPGKSGYDVAAHIKSTPALAHIPVLLLTGAFEPIDEDRAREAGCDGVLAKPFEPQLVIQRVRELLEQPAGAAAGAPGGNEGWALPMLPDQRAQESTRRPAAADPVVDDYFDRLDAAFATLGDRPAPPAQSVAPVEPVMPVMEEPPAPAWPRVDAPTLAVTPAVPPPAALPALSDAFAAILAAERTDPSGAGPAEWPVPPPPAPPVVTEEVIEEVVQRVLSRLTDRVVRETVSDTVSQVAERLVRDEIERIKAQVK